MNLWERVKEAMQDALANSVNATSYPDGPCLEKWVRDDLAAVLADMEKAECVEGIGLPSGSEHVHPQYVVETGTIGPHDWAGRARYPVLLILEGK